jgi:ABC-2 type transport system permease protein
VKLNPVRGAVTRHYVQDSQVHASIAGGVLLVAAAVVVGLAPNLRSRGGSSSLAERLPGGIAALLGIEPGLSVDTAAGHLDAWMLSLAAPLVLCALALPAAVRAVAGSEATGEMEWLAAQPLQRTQIVAERFVAIAIVTAQAALPATVVLVLGGGIGELELSTSVVVFSMARIVLLVSLLAGIVLIVSAATGSLELSVGAALVVPLVTFGLIIAGDTTARISPVRWVLGATPADGGAPVGGLLLAIVITAACVLIASAGFQRRDIIL